MKKILSVVVLGILLIGILAACGQKSQADVVKDLGKKVDSLKGYHTKATMTFKNGKQEKKYQAEIWYQEPNNYKVVLNDGKKENTQMIIKNSDGVFVLTPSQNKKYHFQSEWPNNRSQYYLYQSLIKDIQKDANAKFESKDKNYLFTTKTNYQTQLLANQKIMLNKDLSPKNVQVMDQDMNVMIDITFNSFDFNPTFKKDTFNVDKNMETAKLDTQTSAKPHQAFTIMKPTASIKGATLSYSTDLQNKSGQRQFIMKYAGKKGYTLIESQSNVSPTSEAIETTAQPVNIDESVGVMTDHSLSWSRDGMDFYLVSTKLTPEEMQEVAASVSGQVTK